VTHFDGDVAKSRIYMRAGFHKSSVAEQITQMSKWYRGSCVKVFTQL
jgi:hypothetical protein